MTTLTFNITFYLNGLALAIAPFIIDFKKADFLSKSWFYKISMPTIFFLLIIMGIIKTQDDYNDQNRTTGLIKSLNLNVVSLSDSLKGQRQTYYILVRKLDSIGVQVKDNQPLPVKKIYNNNIENMRDMIQR